jgi:hypothetical protein
MTNVASFSASSVLSHGAASSNVVNMPTRRLLSEPSELSGPWRKLVEARLQELVRLEQGWDGYRGSPVSFVNAVFALRMLESACGRATPSPQIVPGVGGDLQIEWHTLRGDIELHVLAPNVVHAWRSATGGPGYEKELELTNDFSVVATWVRDGDEG